MNHDSQASVEGTAENGLDRDREADAAREGAARVASALERNRKHQEMLYRTLLHCGEPRRFEEVEAFIARQPEMTYGQILQAPRTLIGFLVDAGGIEATAAPSEPQGLIDGEEQVLVTTAAGSLAAEAFHPLIRLESLLRAKPLRSEAFLFFLELCVKPQSYAQIERSYKSERKTLCIASDASVLEADYFVSQLERAGGLVWKKAWTTTEEGRQFAERMRREGEMQPGSTKEDCACRIA
ncbi:hypothetical protein [Raoultibacter massiliensis]|uniref:hypothetical protein n=1 Tax=Raoultibacter massiliensis TaxID=1852371 RepID=UPI000C854C82|nr:hypothetical protein [Raoultibacter massiliensis]